MNLGNMIPKFIWKNELTKNSQEKKIRKCNYFKDLGCLGLPDGETYYNAFIEKRQ